MELNEFIELTLRQITEGVAGAQSAECGENINAQTAGTVHFGGNLIDTGKYGVHTRVDFDVSVSAETSGKGGAKLAVFGVGVDGAAERTVSSANRICFSVPVRLPDGDRERMERVAAERRARRE